MKRRKNSRTMNYLSTESGNIFSFKEEIKNILIGIHMSAYSHLVKIKISQ